MEVKGYEVLQCGRAGLSAVRRLRRDAPCPIASGETLLERRDFRPYFEAYAFDIAIVDVIWNGFYESLKIAAPADGVPRRDDIVDKPPVFDKAHPVQ